MKKIILSTVVMILTITTSFSQTQTTESFGVRGNCGMCKATIEKAANSIDGVTQAVWDKENKRMNVSFDASKTNLKAIHQAIANSGYDTDMVKSDAKTYNNLAGCCQYDREMKIGEPSKKKAKSCCGGNAKSSKKSCH